MLRCDVEGAGNVVWSGCLDQLARQSSTLVRSALVQGEWPMVPGHKPVQEERATAQDNSWQPAGARQQRPMAGSARHAEQISARLVELLLLRDAPVSIPQC